MKQPHRQLLKIVNNDNNNNKNNKNQVNRNDAQVSESKAGPDKVTSSTVQLKITSRKRKTHLVICYHVMQLILIIIIVLLLITKPKRRTLSWQIH